jgi:hypothetical protein
VPVPAEGEDVKLEVDWTLVGPGLVFLGIALIGFITYGMLDRYMGRKEDARLRQDFTRDMKHATAAPWDGETYDWTPETMAFLGDQAYTPDTFAYDPAAPVPESNVSGPLPVISEPVKFEPASDDDTTWLKDWTDAFLAQQGVEQE